MLQNKFKIYNLFYILLYNLDLITHFHYPLIALSKYI